MNQYCELRVEVEGEMHQQTTRAFGARDSDGISLCCYNLKESCSSSDGDMPMGEESLRSTTVHTIIVCNSYGLAEMRGNNDDTFSKSLRDAQVILPPEFKDTEEMEYTIAGHKRLTIDDQVEQSVCKRIKLRGPH